MNARCNRGFMKNIVLKNTYYNNIIMDRKNIAKCRNITKILLKNRRIIRKIFKKIYIFFSFLLCCRTVAVGMPFIRAHSTVFKMALTSRRESRLRAFFTKGVLSVSSCRSYAHTHTRARIHSLSRTLHCSPGIYFLLRT